MRCAVVMAWALVCAWGSARADLVVVGRMPYRDVKILSVTKEKIAFEAFGRTIQKPMAEITRVALSDDAAFNLAEAALAEGKFDEALAGYAASRKKAEKDWHKTLIDYRLAVAKARKAEAGPRLPATGPASKPAMQPATQPAEDTKPGGAEPADPLASPEAFAALLKAQPPHPNKDAVAWANLSEGQQRVAEMRHKGHVLRWANRIRGLRAKKVTWEANFQGAAKVVRRGREAGPRRPAVPGRRPAPPSYRPPRPPSYRPPRRPTARPKPKQPLTFSQQGPPEHWRVGVIVKATRRSGITILANVSPTHAKGLGELQKGRTVRITGGIRRDLEPGASPQMLYLDFARVEILAPAPKPPPKPAPRPATKPAPRPAPRPATKPTAKPKPATRPAIPATKPAAKPLELKGWFRGLNPILRTKPGRADPAPKGGKKGK